jgi:hypothetical protein
MSIGIRQDHSSSTAPIARASRSKSLRSYLVFLGLPLLLFPLATIPSQAQTGTPTTAVPANFFGMTFNKQGSWPLNEPITFGIDRLWNGEAQWQDIETAPGTFDWSNLETMLENDYSAGDTVAFYTMDDTPNWALNLTGTCSSNPDQPACDTDCNNYGIGGNTTTIGAPGQCYPPADLNPDGTGTDATWKAWVTALATENVALCASTSPRYACIQYYEIWNEVDVSSQGYPFPGSSYAAPHLPVGQESVAGGANYKGSYAELVRMLQDAKCIIQGRSSLITSGGVPYAIDNAGGVGVPESCTVVNGIQGSNTAHPATFVEPSSHPFSAQELNISQDFLYCNVADTTTGAPNWCNTGSDAAADIDIINFHMKPANEPDGFYPEQEMLSEYCAIVGNSVSACSGTSDAGILQPAELAKPLWNGESGYSGTGWDPNSSAPNLSGNPDMQASFISRYALIQWSLGIQNFDWYGYDIDQNLDGSSINGTGDQANDPARAYNAIQTWMVGQTMASSGCSIDSGTEWSCNFTGPNGYESSAIWNTSSSYACNADSDKGSDCTYLWTTVGDQWTYYRDLWGDEIQIPTSGTNAHQVQTSNLPVLLENETDSFVPSFALSVQSSTLSVTQGSTSSGDSITVDPVNGFSGSVNLSATGLPAGVTASFNPNPTNNGSSTMTLMANSTAAVGGPVTITVTGTSGLLSASTMIALMITAEPSFTGGSGETSSITVTPGATSGNTGTVSVVGSNGFSGMVGLTCNVTTSMTGVNDMPTCSLNPVSVALSGTTAQTSTLTVNTTAASSAANQMKKLFWPSEGGTSLALIGIFLVPKRRRTWVATLGMFVLFALMNILGCGGGTTARGGSGDSGTTPGTYTITVTGSSGSINTTVATVTLTVQ